MMAISHHDRPTHFAANGRTLDVWADRVEVSSSRWARWPPWLLSVDTIAAGHLRDVYVLTWGNVLVLEDDQDRDCRIALGDQTESALRAIAHADLRAHG
jgi:hypothetical protein